MKKLIFVFLLCAALTTSKRSIAQINGIKIIGDTCTSQTFNLQATGTSSSPYFFWNFGDTASGSNDTITILGSSSTPFPTHTFSTPGVYNVCVSFQEPSAQVTTVCKTFFIGLCCNAIINSSDSCLQNSIPFSVTTATTINSILWNFDDPASGNNNFSIAPNPTHQFSNPGTYTVIATINANCSTYTKTFIKKIVSCLTTNPCNGAILFTDSCQQNAIQFQVSSTSTINNIQWFFDDTASGFNNTSSLISPFHTFTSAGVFKILAIVNFDCGIDTLQKNISIISCNTPNPSTSCDLNLPNAFSPNGDGINDFISPINNQNNCIFNSYEFLIFNRWGQLVFHTKSINQKWDGKYKHKDCPIGTFYYVLHYIPYQQNKMNTKSGYIQLLR